MGNTCCPKANGENNADDEKKALLTSKKATICYMSPAYSLNHESLMGNTPVKEFDELSIVDTQESNNSLNVTDLKMSSESSLEIKDKALQDSELLLKLGRFLLVNDNDLDAIDAEYNEMEEKAHKMLCLWRQQIFPSLNALSKVICQINRRDLISLMEKLFDISFETQNPLKPSITAKADISYEYKKATQVKPSSKFKADISYEYKKATLVKPSSKDIADIYLRDQFGYPLKAEMREAIKKLYLKKYGEMDEIGHLVKTPAKVVLLNKLIKFTVVDEVEVEKNTVSIAEQELFVKRQNQPIEFKEVFSKELPLLLISGIAGIGKTCLLRKCLLDWASGMLWENADLVIYLECGKLNQYQNIGSINKLLNVFYKNIFQESDVCAHFSILFVIDGLDEFAHLDELIKNNPLNPSKLPIVNALADALNIQEHKCVIAGRVGAISRYKDKVKECKNKLTIQVMGFNDKGVDEYIEKIDFKKTTIEKVLKEPYNAKVMASVPFYLSPMCAIIAASDSYTFYTMTELYCCIFLYFFQKHIFKSNEAVHSMMQSESNKQQILRVCKVAWELFNQGKTIYSQDEMKGIVNDFNKVEKELLGFIERVESQLGYQYQFAHLTLMEFCASVHAYIYLSPKEIINNKMLCSCWPMICGLANENKRCFVRFLANLKNSNEERNSLLNLILNLVPKRTSSSSDVKDYDEYKMFMECFFEAQASITKDMKGSIDEREWRILISDGKTAHEVSHEKYFMEKFCNEILFNFICFEAGCKLYGLEVDKNILSEDEKKLVILCSTNVNHVTLYHPVKIDGWTPKHKIEWLRIDISRTFVSKNEFEGFVLPWIRLAEELNLELHDDTNFIDDICEWLSGSNFKELTIRYRGKYFYNIEEFKERKTKKCLIC